MAIKRGLHRNVIDSKLILFFLYNLAFVLYMAGYIPRYVNLMLLAIFIIVNGGEVLKKSKGKIGKKMCFWKETKLMMTSFLAFAIISFIIQIIHFRIELSLITYYLYLVTPLIAAFVWVNNVKKEKLFLYFYVFLARFILNFLLNNAGNISINAISAITIRDSLSSAFESSDAHCFFILMIIFLYYERKTLSIICGLLCMLCFKRLCFILTPIILICYKWIPRKEVNKTLIDVSTVVFIISPLVVYYLTQNLISISSALGIDLDLFSSGRFSIINYVMNNIDQYNGYGSISAYLDQYPYGFFIRITQMHCDVLQIFLETTILGVAIYFYNLFRISRIDYTRYIIVLYFAIEMVFSHFVDVLAAWMILYMFCAMQDKTHFSQISSPGRKGG
ncbi:hypothetical protein SAMN04487771_1003100 [[Clostridium] aminophilum]|uniref:O-antigen ligase like membrane protein n=1 Tax=[Clostridium] aminophilum TaxID=1526 RepID=A0A1I0B650_9FIRM|nr:hypothetical protein [[Clostridium] aminophilum]SET02247.1 hypothetical protein SAMN04487771_1003100 [[Clostridium] aminophilum]